MNNLTYLLQVSACTAIFYLFYYLFLKRLTFFTTNRWYLLATVILSFTIPLIKIQVNEPHVYTGVVEQVVNTYVPQTMHVQKSTITIKQAAPEPIRWDVILQLTYLTAVAGLFVQLIVTLVAFFKRLKGKQITKLGNVNVLSGNKKINNGSFLNFIFLNDEELSADEMQQIIAHEMLHVKLLHSADRIILKIAQIILWFNPFIYLYARSVEENHEFEVDRAMARGTDKHNYANLLVHLSVAGQGMLYHNFSKVPLKRRITMLFNQPSANMKKIIYVLILPVVLISGLAFAKIKSKADEKTPVASVATHKQIDSKLPTPEQPYSPADTKDGIIPYSGEFYKRIRYVEKNKTMHDKIQVSYYDKPGELVTYDLPLSTKEKAGFIIDDKIYNEETFIKIWPSYVKNIAGLNIYPTDGKKPANGPDDRGYDQIFAFNTTKSTVEANEVKENDLPLHNAGYYKRTHYVEKDKTEHDKIQISYYTKPGELVTYDLPLSHKEKAGFIIDDKTYNEDAFIKIWPSFVNSITKIVNIGAPEKTGTGYDQIFEFRTKNYVKPANNDDLKGAITEPDTDYPDLYTRFEFKDKKRVRLDSIRIDFGNTSGVSHGMAGTSVPHNGKVGFIINKVLFTEKAFKNLPSETQKTLREKAFGWGACGKSDFNSMIRRDGLRINLSGYAAVLTIMASKADLTSDLQAIVGNIDRDSLLKSWEKQSPAPAPKGYIKRTKAATPGSETKPGGSVDNKKADYNDTPEGIQQAKLRKAIMGKTITVTVKAIDQLIDPPSNSPNQPTSGIVFNYNGADYSILCWNRAEQELKKQVKTGDVITLKVAAAGSGNGMPVFVTPAYVEKDNARIYEAVATTTTVGSVTYSHTPARKQ